MLPFIDPDFAITERDPDKLHAHAVSLLEQLSFGETGKGSGYSIACVEMAACWLLDQHVEVGVPPTQELAKLMRSLVNPDLDARSDSPVHKENLDAFWMAIKIDGESKHVRPASAVGKQLVDAGVFDGNPHAAEIAVHRWRRNRKYKRNVTWQRQCRTMKVEC